MERYYIIFEGRVQGVGFRFTAQSLAVSYKLTGYVRNQSNGTVAMEVQGPEDRIMAFVKDLRSHSRWIDITNFAMKALPLSTEDKGFKIKY